MIIFLANVSQSICRQNYVNTRQREKAGTLVPSRVRKYVNLHSPCKPLRNNKVTIYNHRVDSPLYVWS